MLASSFEIMAVLVKYEPILPELQVKQPVQLSSSQLSILPYLIAVFPLLPQKCTEPAAVMRPQLRPTS
jgi:hypothetical protein